MKGSCSIPEFYNDQSVFITGATGFMGKVLVEKLLRSCPGIDRVYLLLRPTTGKSAACRLNELVKNEVFDSLRHNHHEVFDKLVPIAGDISSTGLGLSLADQQTLKSSVSIVFHTAARIKFDDDLKSAIDSNVKGPQKVVAFCRQLEKLKVFVHVSTAFNNLDKGEIEETIYPASLNPEKLIEFVEEMDDKLLGSITKQLVGTCPNVYAYTKALGEQLLEKECNENNVPLVVIRPSIVTASVHEPFPGWIDNLNGPSGFITGVGKGLIRTTRANIKLIGDLIPVDIAINLMIAAAWHCASSERQGKMSEAKVYNCATGSHNPLTWLHFNQYGMAAWKLYPTKDMAWYPSLSFRTQGFLYQIEVAIFHYVPAYFFDFIAKIMGRKPFLVRLYDKVHRALSCLDFYVVREWKFVSNNSIELLEKMSTEDRQVFYFDVREINWESYITNYILGCRRFLLKDSLDTLPSARRNLKRLYWVRAFVRILILVISASFFYFFSRIFFM